MKLEYFETHGGADMKGQKSVSKLGSYELSDIKDIISDFKEKGVQFGFQLRTKKDDDTISFSVDDEAEKLKWLFAFEEGLRMTSSRK
jgi:hypothetical protein